MTPPKLAIVEKLHRNSMVAAHESKLHENDSEFFRHQGRLEAYSESIKLIQSDPELFALQERVKRLEESLSQLLSVLDEHSEAHNLFPVTYGKLKVAMEMARVLVGNKAKSDLADAGKEWE